MRKDETEFHNIVVWGKQADVASRFLRKGGLVFIEGRLQTREWEDKQGQKRKTTEIIAERLQLGPRQDGGAAKRDFGSSAPEEKTNEPLPTIELDDDSVKSSEDLPF